MQSQIQISKSQNRTYKQRTSNICLLTYLCIYAERETETETEREREREREKERERESNTFEVERQNDNVFLNMISQHNFPI